MRIVLEVEMPHLRPSTDVHPVTEFRAHTSALIEQVQTTKRPVILTQHGRSAAVLLDVGIYEGLLDEISLLRDVRTAEAQIAAGDTIPHEVVAQQLRERYLK
jgi:prevent-host-death family protein